jgi:hypothetical protein
LTHKELTRARVIARLKELAALPPEQTSGTLKGQVDASKLMYQVSEQLQVLQMLGDIASVDTSRTKGRDRDQEAALKLQKKLLRGADPATGIVQ